MADPAVARGVGGAAGHQGLDLLDQGGELLRVALAPASPPPHPAAHAEPRTPVPARPPA
ncbi:hypothetical protein [Streptomyces sp. SCA2-2]|uniref:hypothetical protein n=1 Tax=Streptomyces sp. SCA2-2 TaxID=1563677 RepID=UPI0013EF0795|nr:hypothetical protein [Streptomyces sp. SCA2-2]